MRLYTCMYIMYMTLYCTFTVLIHAHDARKRRVCVRTIEVQCSCSLSYESTSRFLSAENYVVCYILEVKKKMPALKV